jgi:hypothetical protein
MSQVAEISLSLLTGLTHKGAEVEKVSSHE